MSQNIFLTGANRGLGLKFCEKYLESGSRVFATVRTPSPELLQLKEKYPERIFFYDLDCSDFQSIKNLPSKLKEIPHLDLFINNAGFYPKSDHGSFLEQSATDIEATLRINTVAPIEVTKVLLPLLLKAPHPQAVYITSLMGSIEDNKRGGSYAYRISKAALNMFLKSFSIDYPHITSVVLHPGWVQTDMGGKEAPLTPDQSIAGMMQVISKLKNQDSGQFFNYDGKKLPW